MAGTLTDKLQKGTMSRREMLSLLAKAGIGAVAGSALACTGCKSPSGPEPPIPGTKVNLTIYYRNAQKGEIYQEVLPGIDSGSQVIVDFNKISGKPLSNVDPNRITIRDTINGIGNLITHVNYGQATFNAPNYDKTYSAYFYDTSNGANYDIIDNDSFAGAGSKLVFGTRNMLVKYENKDGQICPDGVYFGSIGGYRGALDQLNDAMQTPFGKWGSITLTTGSRHFGAGAGDCGGALGQHLGNWIGVNYGSIGNDPRGLVTVALEEGFEIICDVDNIGGQPSSMRIQTMGQLLPVGGDYLIYTLGKDKLGNV